MGFFFCLKLIGKITLRSSPFLDRSFIMQPYNGFNQHGALCLSFIKNHPSICMYCLRFAINGSKEGGRYHKDAIKIAFVCPTMDSVYLWYVILCKMCSFMRNLRFLVSGTRLSMIINKNSNEFDSR